MTTFQTMREPGQDAKLTDPRLLEALAAALDNADVLLRRIEGTATIQVLISYGSTERDDATVEGFDTAEWGNAPELEDALRFALGAHFHSDDDN